MISRQQIASLISGSLYEYPTPEQERLCDHIAGIIALASAQQEPPSAEKRIAELTAERDEARHQYARVELQALEYHNRMQDAIARAEAAEQALQKYEAK